LDSQLDAAPTARKFMNFLPRCAKDACRSCMISLASNEFQGSVRSLLGLWRDR
jgi:hypothetical protein